MIINGNALHLPLADGCVQTCVTSPPYFGLRDYGHEDQLGAEATPEAFVANLVAVFREVRRVLRDDGTAWLNLGDSYAGSGRGGNPEGSPHLMQRTNKGSQTVVKYETRALTYGLKPKDLIGIPWRVAFALQADGWWLRQDIIWHKPNPMPESVTDRCTKAHEYIFLLSKSARYFYDADAVKEDAVTGWNGSSFCDDRDIAVRPSTGRQPRFGGIKYGDSNDPMYATKSGNEYAPNGLRNKRSVWTVSTQPYSGAHYATFPPKLIEPCIKAGSRKGDIVLDPFIGSGTTGLVCERLGRRHVGIELHPENCAMARARIRGVNGELFA